MAFWSWSFNFLYLEKLFPNLFNNKSLKSCYCEIYQLAKHTRHVYPSIQYTSSHPFSIIHSDIWGPSKVKNINGTCWLMSFIDDHTKTTWIFLMKEKLKIKAIFKSFHSMISIQFKTKIQVLNIDNTREVPYIMEQGIIDLSSCVDIPQQNGVAERKNGHLLEVAQSIMFTNNVPKYFQGKAILSTTYVTNRMSNRVLKFQNLRQVLMQTFSYIKSSILDFPFKVFECLAFVHCQT